MSSRVVRAGMVVFALGAATALGCSIIVDFDETKIPSETDGGADSTAETSVVDSGTDTGTDTGTPTDTDTDSGTDSGTDGGGGDADASDTSDGGADATDSGADTTVTDSGTDTTTADTADSAAADTADSATADTADSATADTADSATADTDDGATDAASDTSDGATDAASDASGDTADGGAGTTFTAALDGGQELPANTSTATGKAVCVLNAAETALDCTVTHTVTSATTMHLHEAFGGLSGGITFTFDAGTSPQTKSFAITSGQVTNLKAGKYYANVHSTTLTGGEIRGQLLKPGQKLYTAAPLAGANQVPAVTNSVTGGTGCVLDGTAFTCNGAASGFGTETPGAAHIHEGNSSTNGGVKVTFTLGTFGSDAITWSGSATVGTDLDATKLAAATTFLASEYYVNLHSTPTFSLGAARSQLVLRMTAPAP